jgi:hypothetical protein
MKPMIRIHNISTNEVIDREMNADEFADYQANLADQGKRETEATAKEIARQAVLDKLGLTTEEIAAFLP